MSLRHIQGHYFFNRYVRFLSALSATNSVKMVFTRDNSTQHTSALSWLVEKTLFIRYSITTYFCSAVFAVTFYRHFFIAILRAAPYDNHIEAMLITVLNHLFNLF